MIQEPLSYEPVLQPVPTTGASRLRLRRVPQYLLRIPFTVLAFYWSARCRSLLDASDLDVSKTYIIAANHQSSVDPFVICNHLPQWAWRKLGTFRFFAYSGLFRSPLLRACLEQIGAFPTKPLRGHVGGLEEARIYFSHGDTLMIFPEGRRTLPGATPARRGIGEMAQWPNARIIPVRLQWHKTRFGRRYSLTIGRPFDASSMSSQDILDAIYDLPLPE